jgi:hypothetical protein
VLSVDVLDPLAGIEVVIAKKSSLAYFFPSGCYVLDREQYDASEVYSGCK